MWEKPEHLTVAALARPLRIAYLVDLGDCPDALLDAIFAEAYGRWGGRRTLIVPATAQGIDARYADWLGYFDADILYSFVALDDAAVARMHERYGPAHLVKHRADPDSERASVLSCRSPVFRACPYCRHFAAERGDLMGRHAR